MPALQPIHFDANYAGIIARVQPAQVVGPVSSVVVYMAQHTILQ